MTVFEPLKAVDAKVSRWFMHVSGAYASHWRNYWV